MTKKKSELDAEATEPFLANEPQDPETVQEVENSESSTEDAKLGAPTVQEAEQMFRENIGLSSVLTDSGFLSREGILTAVATGE